ncbi:hypothetical protein M422DRAFT_268278 [Sphaerobolus stellatus SS14]|uniref:Uncharacterized protein n=1 Tax=Sphaerobolus stellatus (strain SS14) TaxID=990650 RepID=A0A0C9UN13_SPHS4|nr:hypothetical protein M422DRAFT_268278 [Sphaerobolus stellatus SS14]
MAGASSTATQGLHPSQVAGALATATLGLDSPWGIISRSESGQNLGDAPDDPECVSPDEGDTDDDDIDFTVPASEIKTSMNKMSPMMKKLFIVSKLKSSGKAIKPGNNWAHDKAAAKGATE